MRMNRRSWIAGIAGVLGAGKAVAVKLTRLGLAKVQPESFPEIKPVLLFMTMDGAPPAEYGRWGFCRQTGKLCIYRDKWEEFQLNFGVDLAHIEHTTRSTGWPQVS